MAPPSFTDLGSEAKDVLLDNYPMGWKVKGNEIPIFGTTKMKASYHYDTETEFAFATLKAEDTKEDSGWKFVQKWNSFHTLVSRLYFGDINSEHGLRISSELAINLAFRTINPAVKASCRTDYLNTKLRIGNFPNVPAVSHSLVTKYGKVRLGYKIDTDSTPKLNQCSFAGQVFGEGYNLTTKANFHCDNTTILDQTINGTLYHKISEQMETAVSMAFYGPLNSGHGAMSMGMKYAICENHILRAKISHRCQLGFSVTRSLLDGCQLTAAVGMSLINFSSGKKSFGFRMEFS